MAEANDYGKLCDGWTVGLLMGGTVISDETWSLRLFLCDMINHHPPPPRRHDLFPFLLHSFFSPSSYPIYISSSVLIFLSSSSSSSCCFFSCLNFLSWCNPPHGLFRYLHSFRESLNFPSLISQTVPLRSVHFPVFLHIAHYISKQQ